MHDAHLLASYDNEPLQRNEKKRNRPEFENAFEHSKYQKKKNRQSFTKPF